MATFEKPRTLTESEVNYLSGKCLMVGHATLGPTASEVMQLIGHYDLLVGKLKEALRLLSGCMPDRVFVIDDTWSSEEPDDGDCEVIDFVELLGERDGPDGE